MSWFFHVQTDAFADTEDFVYSNNVGRKEEAPYTLNNLFSSFSALSLFLCETPHFYLKKILDLWGWVSQRKRKKSLTLRLFMAFLCQFYIDIKYGSVLKDINHIKLTTECIFLWWSIAKQAMSHTRERKKREVLDRRESNQSVLARSECEAHVFQSNSN